MRTAPPACPLAPAALVTLLALVWLGCVSVHTDYDPSVDFGRAGSFAWLEPPLRDAGAEPPGGPADPFVHNTLLDKRVRDAVESALRERGYRMVESDPDFQLRYRVVSRQVTRDSTFSVGGGVGHHHRHHGHHLGGYSGSSYSYQEGTLILDVIDPRSETIAWRGWASTRTQDGHIDAGRIERYVRRILAEFPPGPAAAPPAPEEG